MITPGLWRRALARGAQWRLLLLTVVAVALPATLAALPILSFLGELFDRTPRSRELVGALDSAGLIEVLRQLGDARSAAALPGGVVAAALTGFLLAPALAGAALAAARADGALRFRALLQGAGEYYGRLLRTWAVALLPWGLAGAVASAGIYFARKSGEAAVLEASATRSFRLALLLGAAALALAQITLDAGRAHFAAEPERRSAFFAWLRGVALVVRHPVRALALCAVTSVLGLGLAFLLTALRLRLPQSSAGTLAGGFLMAQLAVAAVAWERASRLAGLTELVRIDLAGRARRRAAPEASRFQMAPPLTSPPPAPVPAGPEVGG